MSQSEYSIRAARRDDVPALQAIECAAAERFAAIGMGEVISSPSLTTELLELFFKKGIVFVCTHEAQPIGLVAGCMLDECGHVAEVDVVPQHAGKRIGSRLIDRLARWASKQGAQLLTLSTYRDVPWNAPYYTRLGFEIAPLQQLGPEHHRMWEEQRAMGLDMSRRVVMVRSLSRAQG